MRTTHEFGPLDGFWGSVTFSCGSIEPITTQSDFHAYLASDHVHFWDEPGVWGGYLYPPVGTKMTRPVGHADWTPTPNTTRTQHLWRPHATHRLMVGLDDPDRELSAFIIHFAAYLFGVRVEFADWWLDGRIVVKPRPPFDAVDENELVRLLDEAVTSFSRMQNPDGRRGINNLLYLHNRSAGYYHWPWELMIAEYMCLELGWDIATKLNGVPKKIQSGKSSKAHMASHKERVALLCRHLGIDEATSQDRDRLVNPRNDVLHDALWNGIEPTRGGGDLQSPLRLRRFVERLVIALLGIDCEFRHSPWTSGFPVLLGLAS